MRTHFRGYVVDPDGEKLLFSRNGNSKMLSDVMREKALLLPYLKDVAMTGKTSIEPLREDKKDRKDYKEFKLYEKIIEPKSGGKYKCVIEAGRLAQKNDYEMLRAYVYKISATHDKKREPVNRLSSFLAPSLKSSTARTLNSIEDSLYPFFEIVNMEAEPLFHLAEKDYIILD